MIAKLHNWNLTPEEAAHLQIDLRNRLILTWDNRPIATVGGVDVSVKTETARAAIVVLRYPELKPVEGVTADAPLVQRLREGSHNWDEGVQIGSPHSSNCSGSSTQRLRTGAPLGGGGPSCMR